MKSRSGDLLRRLMVGGDMNPAEIRRTLGVGSTDFDQIVSGTKVMTLPHQLGLADLVIERVPRLARLGRMLRGQVLAAMSYNDGETTVHASQPLKWSRFKASRA